MDEYERERQWVAIASLALTMSFLLGVIVAAYVDVLAMSIAAGHDNWLAHSLAAATVSPSLLIGVAIWRWVRSSSPRAALWGLVAAAAISIACSQLMKHGLSATESRAHGASHGGLEDKIQVIGVRERFR